jgi:hypothetical protein
VKNTTTPTKHAKLSPSGAKLDIHCPGNRREQAKYPRSSSKASANGTGLHELAAACLLRKHDTDRYIGYWCGENTQGAGYIIEEKPAEAGKVKGFWAFPVSAEDAQNVQVYLDHVRSVAYGDETYSIGVEQKIEISEYCWGTADAVVSFPYAWVHISDYKNGYTFVHEDTEQLKLYLVGKIGLCNDFEYQKAHATIVQPNATHAAAVRTKEYDVEELLTWYREVYQPAGEACLKPDAPCFAGPWCKEGWCDARHSCPTLTGLADDIAQGMFTAVDVTSIPAAPLPVDMTPEKRARILEFGPILIDFVKSVQDYEYSLALSGTNTWGKLVEGRNSRAWKDEKTAEGRLNILLKGEAFERKLKSPAKVETALKAQGLKPKQAKEKIDDLIIKTAGNPKLVHVNAKGKTFVPAETMFNAVE